ncbi:Heavy metal transport/detoxification superfamily protein [Arabidopsis thaliana]|uniref:Heavy metal transport/detoxification superfamily protein n=1 Tax=Arabidopsis thaliana TaxID=3702 RepID=F4K0H3_ARATH|nr:Heavy metal transport/detoxification superfamily protein [Arabidopsis thaliana]AED97379.1 Heavy metal transport/detoxification superfamily protein [Arabidopsis thaliana]|eukprot:NP_001190582.1 Heavy metal transport/detoxification superfamily protein [Arabidopsis thaliana]
MGEKKNEGDNKKKGGDNKKKNETPSITVVLKVDMHCEGCASRIVKCVRSFQGVETVKSESATGKLTVTGALDPVKLREKLEEKTKKKVDLVSPQPKKEKEKENKNKNDEDKKKSEEKKKPDNNDKKPKETPVTTAVLKLNFHCQGCIGKIQKTVTKTKGVNGLTMDKEKNLLTVKGTMDVKKLVEILSEKLKRAVEIVPPKKEKDKENGNENGEKKKGGGGDGGGKEKTGNKGGGEGVNMMEYMAAQPAYGYGYYPGGPYGYPIQAHAPQIFSDENPNACVVILIVEKRNLGPYKFRTIGSL